MTTGHSLKNVREERARFLFQTTFGPTISEIDGWSHGTGVKGYADYIQAQMELPPTLHREYWRKRIDFAIMREHPRLTSQVPNHPCNQYSRWRDFVFTGTDYGTFFSVTSIEVAGSDMLMISVLDTDTDYYEPRTVMATFPGDQIFDNGVNCTSNSEYCGVGEYHTCYSFGEGINGFINYRPKDTNSACKNFHNPKIYLPEEVINLDANTIGDYKLQYVDLPAKDNFEYLPGVIAELKGYWFVGQSWRMLVDNWNQAWSSQCSSFKDDDDKWDFRYLVGVGPTGEQLHYDGYAVLGENSVENPLVDGGASVAEYSGRTPCANSIMDFTNIESCKLSEGDGCVPVESSSERYGLQYDIKNKVVVCGSLGEVANNLGFEDKYDNNMFRMPLSSRAVFASGLGKQKGNAWSQIALEANDQLRQRVAWALSQLLVVTPKQIDDSAQLSECFLNYHDIFVRNAFGNYRDILKEVSYSPMMGEMLSYLESRSAAYVARVEKRVSRPDENYAREIMQLFTIGVHWLNDDGSVVTVKTDNGRSPLATYDNSDIQNFARAWTGFRRHARRGNYEGYWSSHNRINPMPLEGPRRDQFPKMDLFNNYIGDGYPECIDLPEKQFLRIGATYRLLGSNNSPLMHSEEWQWPRSEHLTRLLLNTTSALYKDLCNANGSGCIFQPQVHINSNLECDQNECNLDSVRIVQVQENPPIFYEYLKPACVEFAFQKTEDLQKVVDHNRYAMCLNKKVNDAAMPVCCSTNTVWVPSECNFSLERVSYTTNEERCPATDDNIGVCSWENVYFPEPKCQFYGWTGGNYRTFHWTNETCSTQARVTTEGTVAIVHNPNMDINNVLADDKQQNVTEWVNSTNVNFFKVKWKGGEYPNPNNACGDGACMMVENECLCEVHLTRRKLFKSIPTLSQSARLVHGAPNPAALDSGEYTLSDDSTGDVTVYHMKDRPAYSKNTIFSVVRNETRVFLKNYVSRVNVAGSITDYSFRNPVSMMSLVNPESRDAHYETDAVIDHYFYHPNTPTFVAMRLLERFGHSNPSPRYIQVVSKAFSRGEYMRKKKNISIGSGKYGDLGATVAAILLDREAKTPSLDADPSSGSFREPLLKYIGLMRSMELEKNSTARELRLDRIQTGIGQYAYNTPNVFSFFLPEYAAPGQITESNLVSPEAMVINAPTVVGFLNGAYALIDLGLNSCFKGFGGVVHNACQLFFYNWFKWDPEIQTMATLRYQPSTTDAETVVDELALLLTAGRLSPGSRRIVREAYDVEFIAANAASALRLAQKLVISTPEYHSTNTVKRKEQLRPDPEIPVPSQNEYKAIIILNLNGGMDGFNMLVPHSDCNTDQDVYENYKAARGNIGLLKQDLLTISASTSDQICDTFGLHPNLNNLKTLYNEKELLFIANMGLLQQTGITEQNWRSLNSETNLFSHNTQTEETANVDIFDKYAGIGVGGRMIDILVANGYKTGAISVSGNAPPIVSKSTPLLAVNPYGYDKFNPIMDNNVVSSNKKFGHDMTVELEDMNGATTAGSTFYGDTWSEELLKALSENSMLYDLLQEVTLDEQFPNHHFGRQMSAIAKMMKTKDDRGKDRDVFFVEGGGWDMHFDIELPLRSAFEETSSALMTFRNEMKKMEVWDQVTVVVVSEFGRTLMGNTGNGSDHAWGGNYFIMGGGLKHTGGGGGKILGTYPDLTEDSPIIFQPGIVIPTTPWESMWNPIAQWFGIGDSDLDKILPNRQEFVDNLFSKADFYGAE